MDMSKMTNDELVNEASNIDAFSVDHAEAVAELARRLEKAGADRAAMLSELEAAWSFDSDQIHTHTWHTKNDFMDRWAATDASRGGAK